MHENKNRFALLVVALGCWLIAIPLTFNDHPIESNDIICGLLLIVFGAFSLAPTRIWSGWAVGLVGVWLQMAPLVFWAPISLMYVNDTLVGAIAIVLSFTLAKKSEIINGNGQPAGWSYNPSGWAHRIPTVTLAMLCWFFSRYMAAFQLGYIDHIWDPFFAEGTLRVITSDISKNFPVSDAGLGALCYSVEFLLGWQGTSRRWYNMPWLVLAFAFLVIPVGIVSITLIILQPVVVGAWCTWCLATAACMLLMIVLTAGELVATLQFLKETKKRGSSIWHAIWKGGRPDLVLISAKPRNLRFKYLPLGITFPWNLVVTAVLGIWLMASPTTFHILGNLAVNNYIEGPMIAAVSMIAFSEVFRALRYLNILFGIGLILAPMMAVGATLPAILNNCVIGLLVIAFSFRKGEISERYGAWEKRIL